ncbi:MAG: ROK family protein [Candidatus Margulisbacteria bacterium]|nr:ROK family protein [Candidatus Margulisiibacteriota bacterium]MBU1021652.1 ROK family protein [Candidatus Margulisiibacteriota bacterium]MBU1728802.1 ROK family protein [Candidatus Margulisiibacteriota bacterium]MBU1955768.1 ROK family protein [Candidatus Margulisiibacteriota bacterium]
MAKQYVIGVDLGGTKISAALADHKGNLIQQIKVPTQASLGKNAVINNMVRTINELILVKGIKLNQIKAIGVGAPGPVLVDKGIVENPPNLTGWKRVNLKRILQKKLHCKVILENDANLAALAEARVGAGQGIKNFVYITVSTGIGGGIIINGDLYRGANGAAGEVGHFIVDQTGNKCGCGNLGCLEAMASGLAMRKIAVRKLRERYSKILELVDGDIDRVDAEVIARAAKAGDALAKEIIHEIVDVLAKGFAGIVNILNPSLIVVGGGLANIGSLLFTPLNKRVKKYALPTTGRAVKVIKAKLGDHAGVIGAIQVCL